MDNAHIRRALKRIAIQIWEKMDDCENLMVIGLNERGYAMAKTLVSHLEKLFNSAIDIHQFTVKQSGSAIPNCTEKKILIVDDVIFSGKTLFDALSAICFSNDPDSIEIVTLIDRGHRKYPLAPRLTGMEVPTKFGEHIEVMLHEGKLDQVILFKNN